MEDNGIGYAKDWLPNSVARTIVIKKDELSSTNFDIDALRDTWYKTSYLLDRDQSLNGCAAKRYTNYKKQPVEMKFNDSFKGTLESYGLNADRRTAIRCQGCHHP